MIKKITFILFCSLSMAFANDPIFVYGSFLNESIYSEASSLSVRDGEDIENYNATHFEELVNSIPNLNTSMGSQRARYFQVRGIGERSSYEGMPNHSVGVVVDDIDYSGIGGVTSLLGTEQVEVYKGPQSTKLGPSAMAAMIHMTSINPSNESRGDVHFSIANFNTFEEALSFSAKNFALSVSKRDSDGYIRNEYLNQKDTNGQDEFVLRTKFLKAIGKSKLKLTLHFLDFNNGYDVFNHENSYTTFSDKPGRDDQQTFSQAIKVNHDFSDELSSETILIHQENKTLYSYDEDWKNDVFWNSLAGYNDNYNYDIAFIRKRENIGLDQRLKFDDKRILGLYVKNNRENFQEVGYKDNSERKNIIGEFKTNQYALYAENQAKLNEQSWVEYGVRTELSQSKYTDTLRNSFSPSDFMYGGHISFNIQENSNKDEDLKYIKVSKGYKTGGFNTQSSVPAHLKEYDPESLYSLELGYKKFFSNINMDLSSTAFFMYREDVQVKSSFQDDPMDPSSYSFYNTNATDGFNYGLELESLWMPIESFELVSTLGLLKTKYGDYKLAGNSLKGREMPHAPEYQFNILAKYYLLDELNVSTNFFFSDDFYFSNSHSQEAPSYQLVDVKVQYEINDLSVSLWSKNIFNEKYSLRGFYFSNMPPDWNEERYVQLGSPRTYGVTLKAQF